MQFAEPMPQLARMADDLCLVRSFSHDSNDHLLSQVYTLSGRKVTKGSTLHRAKYRVDRGASVRPAERDCRGYIAVPGITRPGPPPHNLFVGGWLGNQYAPFCVGGQPEQPDFTVGEKSENPSPVCDEDLDPQELSPPAEMTIGRLSRRASLRESLESSPADR